MHLGLTLGTTQSRSWFLSNQPAGDLQFLEFVSYNLEQTFSGTSYSGADQNSILHRAGI